MIKHKLNCYVNLLVTGRIINLPDLDGNKYLDTVVKLDRNLAYRWKNI